ncbi:MAG TPA: tetratricopeptide repeat protein [Bacteroidales bacterium]|nr:tetratricopeptide repeat protein [Bacteroidales bacterium]HOK98122.1 tetratricopeptide repeat protein [Bacteroidales bacterium]HPO64874.1 tetratricopeptide repeat protein [Bacteroidales bacterium]
MKKIFLLFLCLMTTGMLIAQKKVVRIAEKELNKGNIKTAWDTLQSALQHEETKGDANTWFLRGLILQSMAKSTDSTVRNLVDSPVKQAYESYEKALQIDVKMRNKVNLQLNDLYIAAVMAGSEAFEKKNYAKALDMFELALQIETAPIFKNIVDTSMYYNSGLAALNAKNYDKAIEYFQKAAQYGYNGGVTYSLLRTAYAEKGDSAAALRTLQEGFEKYPNDLNMIVDLVNYYIVAQKVEDALKYLSIAKEKEPNNSSFYFAEGTLYEKLNDFDKAEAAYRKATEIDPQSFNAWYNLGVLYYNKAVKVFDEASNEKDDAKYNQLLEQGNELLKQCIPYLEQAHKIDPKEETCAKTLRGLYFRMQMKDKYDAINAEMGW